MTESAGGAGGSGLSRLTRSTVADVPIRLSFPERPPQGVPLHFESSATQVLSSAAVTPISP